MYRNNQTTFLQLDAVLKLKQDKSIQTVSWHGVDISTHMIFPKKREIVTQSMRNMVVKPSLLNLNEVEVVHQKQEKKTM